MSLGTIPSIPLPMMEVSNIDTTQGITNDKGDKDMEHLLKLPLTDDMLSQLQSQDMFLFPYNNTNKKGEY